MSIHSQMNDGPTSQGTSSGEPRRTSPPDPAVAAGSVSPGAVLLVVSVAAFMASLDLFIVNVAIPEVGRDLSDSSLSDLSWILNSYAIVYAALLVPLGRLADRYGRRGGFQLGLAVFTTASLGCALSQDLALLVAFRIVQAAGAALLTPTSLALLLSATPAATRARAVRIWAATGALAAAAGPAVGGVLVEASWRWVFLINLPVGLVALLRGRAVLPASREARRGPLPDLFGAVLLTVGIAALSLGLVKGPDWGWTDNWTLGAFAVFVIATAWFALRDLRHPSPVIEPSLLRVRSFAAANLAAVLFSVGFAANLLACVLWMQNVWEWSAIKTGLGIAAGPAVVPLFAAVGQRLSGRLGAGAITAAGCVLFAAGMAILAGQLDLAPSYASTFLPGLLVGGSGVGLALPTILSSATADLPADRSATGSAVVNMSRQVGAVLGVAIVVAVLGTPTTPLGTLDAFREAFWIAAIAVVLAAAVALPMTPRRTPGPSVAAEPTTSVDA